MATGAGYFLTDYKWLEKNKSISCAKVINSYQDFVSLEISYMTEEKLSSARSLRVACNENNDNFCQPEHMHGI